MTEQAETVVDEITLETEAEPQLDRKLSKRRKPKRMRTRQSKAIRQKKTATRLLSLSMGTRLPKLMQMYLKTVPHGQSCVLRMRD